MGDAAKYSSALVSCGTCLLSLPPIQQSGGGILQVPPSCLAAEALRHTTCPCLSPFPSCHPSKRAQYKACLGCSAPLYRWHLAVSVPVTPHQYVRSCKKVKYSVEPFDVQVLCPQS